VCVNNAAAGRQKRSPGQESADHTNDSAADYYAGFGSPSIHQEMTQERDNKNNLQQTKVFASVYSA
jgi:hypothetical protein